MASVVPLLKDPKRKEVQETLLRYGIAPETARSVASVELRNWSSQELKTALDKLASHRPDPRSFKFHSTSLVSSMASLFMGTKKSAWLKPPQGMMERSAKDGLALCVNAAGEWALLKDGYFAISHVWEEGIQADPHNRGVPLADVQQIIARIQETGAEWIWLDALAIPGTSRGLSLHEEELKVAIINSLADIYKRAAAVIIFDALTMQLRSTNLIDVAACLLCGKWMTRVWTHQEIYLAKRALIVTQNGIVEFLDMTRRLRAISGNDNDLAEIFGADRNHLDDVSPAEKNSLKYEELYIAFARLLGTDGKKPSLTQLALTCHGRKTGNDIDYARAFFPVLGLKWKNSLTREEGMELIYDEQRYYSKRLVLMHGSPRSLVRPGWAPSYLTGLEGRPIAPSDPLGDIEWEKRGLKRNWYTYQVKAQHPTSKENVLVLEIHEGGTSGVLCGCEVSVNERPESIVGYSNAIINKSAYILSNKGLSFPTDNGLGYNVMLVERNEEDSHTNEAWVYLTAAVIAIQKSLAGKSTPWLILHESPISAHMRSGKDFSKIARQLSDEKALHKGQTPLHLAAEAGEEEALLELLLASNNDLESQDHGQVFEQQNQQQHREGVNSRDERGWTPLHNAAFGGHVLSVRLLIEHGAVVDAEDSSERSPLMLAADEGHTDAIKELLKHGANVNLSHPNAKSPLNQALLRGHFEAVKTLLTAGANPNGRDQFGFAPLLVASTKDVKFVELLISAGADPTADLVGGATSVHFAARANNIPLLSRLLDLGIPVDLPRGEAAVGTTPLYDAIGEQAEEAVSVLLAHGANVNHPMEGFWSCVLLAVKIGNYGIARMVVKAGADVRAVCQPEGWTALHVAAMEGHRLVVRLLLGEACEVNARDAKGDTPLKLAQNAGHGTIVEILRKAGGV